MTTILEKLKTEKRTHARLSDFIKIKHGYAFKGEYFGDKGSHVVVTPGNFFEEGGFRRRENKDKWYSGSIPEDYILDKGDVVIAMTEQGEGLLGSSAIIPSGDLFLHNQRIGLVEIKDEKAVDRVFLYNLFNSRRMRSHIQSSASGTKVRHTAPDRITSYEYDFPSLPMQKKIADILSAYDEKISSNNEAIANLEEIAATLFEEWFIKFHFPGHDDVKFVEDAAGRIPAGWTVEPLDQIANFLNGIASQKYPAISGQDSLPVIKIREMNSGINEGSERASKSIDSKYIVKNGDILFSWSGSLELMIWSDGDGVLNQHIFKVTSDRFEKWFYFYWIKKYLQNFRAIAEGKATTMGHIQRHHLSESLVIVPTASILKVADSIFNPLFDQLYNLRLENKKLKQSRDLLLVKLIN